MIPPMPRSGSTSSAARLTPSRSRIASQLSASFHGSTITFFSVEAGMPSEDGSGLGRVRPPAALVSGVTLTSTVSWVPWKAPSNLAIFDRPVKARAARRAFMVASVPELVKRTL